MLRNGKIITEEVSIVKRKLALTKICQDLFIDHKEYMRLASDQEFSKFTKKRSYWKATEE